MKGGNSQPSMKTRIALRFAFSRVPINDDDDDDKRRRRHGRPDAEARGTRVRSKQNQTAAAAGLRTS
jgi:hypothetical protein